MSEAADAIEQLHARGVTDGLPVVPPTRALVDAMIAASDRRADELIASVAPANGRATIEKIAINAVMAGCRPEYMPVVVAAVRAMCDDAFDLVGISGTTDAVAPIFIVNGPARVKLVNDVLDLTDLGHKRDSLVDGLSRGIASAFA